MWEDCWREERKEKKQERGWAVENYQSTADEYQTRPGGSICVTKRRRTTDQCSRIKSIKSRGKLERPRAVAPSEFGLRIFGDCDL